MTPKCPPGYSAETHRRFSKLYKMDCKKKENETKPYHHAQIRTGRSVNEQLLTREWCRTKCNHDYKRTANLVDSMWFQLENVHVAEKPVWVASLFEFRPRAAFQHIKLDPNTTQLRLPTCPIARLLATKPNYNSETNDDKATTCSFVRDTAINGSSRS